MKSDEGSKLAKSHGYPFFETSAKSGENVASAYGLLAEIVTQRMLAETKRTASTSSMGSVKLNDKKTPNGERRGCC